MQNRATERPQLSSAPRVTAIQLTETSHRRSPMPVQFQRAASHPHLRRRNQAPLRGDWDRAQRVNRLTGVLREGAA